MDLYFAPLACSLATRIALYEAGVDARYIQVDTHAKRLSDDGSDYYAINPLGLVPMLRTDEGELLSENTAVLQYVAERFPDAKLAPAAGYGHHRLRQWLGFIGTELHKAVFVPQLERAAPPEAKAYARGKATLRLDLLQKHLAGQDYLLDDFSVADAYLFVVLNWAGAVELDLAPWPALTAYRQRLLQRDGVQRAFREELELYQAEQARAAR
jgi:glutathione S-transferase